MDQPNDRPQPEPESRETEAQPSPEAPRPVSAPSSDTAGRPLSVPSVQPGASVPDMHSGLGIASFVIAIVVLLLVAVSIVMLAASNPESLIGAINEGMSDEELAKTMLSKAPLLIVGTLVILFASFMTFIGAVLGISGLLQPNRKRLFAVLGTIINGGMVLFVLFIGLLAVILT